ncbi:MAG: FKBP-type peptidyl-prolyl cis-trans isomerase [Thiotrichaceae bacterium]|nr:FKBP-type peptidyl-prolyl cis-trans isomerase [Thiotrichaceae bacterium]PCI13103.1 MAG: peptidylprolyl isomerase [Thiotrichales bacterium]
MKRRFIFLPLAILFTTLLALSGCSEQAPVTNASEGVTALVKKDVKIGDGDEAAKGDMISVHYTGWLYHQSAMHNKSKKFDSSRDRGQPFGFKLGAGRVIQGWDLGVLGMKVGGQRTLTIPSSLGYGARSAGGSIPPNATLVFDVELLNIR